MMESYFDKDKFCKFPNCYNYVEIGSDFCFDHKYTPWFQPIEVDVYVGDLKVGKIVQFINDDEDKQLKMSIDKTLHPSKFKEVTQAVYSRMNQLFEPKFHFNEDDWSK